MLNLLRKQDASRSVSRKRTLSVETLEVRELLSINTLQVPEFSSLPESTYTIFLDFNGHNVATKLGQNGVAVKPDAFDLDGNPDVFSSTELRAIHDIWAATAELFSPFNVNVTTIDPGDDALKKSSLGDNAYGIRIAITSSTDVVGEGWVRSFTDNSSDVDAVVGCKNFNKTRWNISIAALASTIAHEAGHNLGLQHDGKGNEEYYFGRYVDATTGWMPIMGGVTNYTHSISQWSCGDYTGANNQEDDLSIITTKNGFGYRADEPTRSLVFDSSAIMGQSTATANGIIAQTDDYDDFTFTVNTAGDYSFSVKSGVTIDDKQFSSLYFYADLYKDGTLISHHLSSLDTLTAAWADVSMEAGNYSLRIGGTGYTGSGNKEGFSSYGSLGTYVISVTTNTATDPPVIPPALPSNEGKAELVQNKETSRGDVSWKAVSQDTVSVRTVYVVQYRPVDGDGKWKSVSVTPAKAVSTGETIHKILTLKAGTVYEIQVYAKAAKGENVQSVQVPFFHTTLRTYALVKPASLGKLKASELPADFNAAEQLAVKVKNLIMANEVGTLKTKTVVDTVTITYTYSKTKKEKITATETLKFADGIWSVGTNITFDNGIILIRNLSPKTLYKVTVQFSNTTEGQEALPQRVSVLSASTAKASWTHPVSNVTAVSSLVDAKPVVTVNWDAAVDDYETQAASYTVRVYSSNGSTLAKKITVKNSQLSVGINGLKLGKEYFITVTANADTFHLVAAASEKVGVTT